MDWTFLEALRSSSFDTVKTVFVVVGGIFVFIQLRESYRLRRLQVLSSFNERLGKCAKDNFWIWESIKMWSTLKLDIKYEYQNYIATFEDIGLARSARIISRSDFIASYGGRFSKLIDSGTLHQFMRDVGFQKVHFENLRVLCADVGTDFDLIWSAPLIQKPRGDDTAVQKC